LQNRQLGDSSNHDTHVSSEESEIRGYASSTLSSSVFPIANCTAPAPAPASLEVSSLEYVERKRDIDINVNLNVEKALSMIDKLNKLLCTKKIEKSETNLSQLPSIVSTQDQTNNSEQFLSITEAKKELPESLISLSSGFLIKSESDIDTLILLLQRKFQMSQEKLEQWRTKIAFEMWDNNNYWKKECESMSEADFLEYKQNFETKMGVPTTPHKKELKNKSLALIEYG
ncbi:2010_t:CDS:2, partial [Entrophospora sp. SA101]